MENEVQPKTPTSGESVAPSSASETAPAGAPPPPTSAEEKARAQLIKQAREKKQRKKLLIGCSAFFIAVVIFFILTLIIFLTQAKSGQSNPILSLIGINEANLIKSLISLSNFGFGIFSFIAFLVTVMGLFKLLILKKEDIAGKRSGIVTMILGIIIFSSLIFGWIASYLYLSGITPASQVKDVPLADQIITDPANLTNLVAPVTVSFDASQIATDPKTSFVWDFGDESLKGTGPKVSHKYTSKPAGDQDAYTIILTVTSYIANTPKKQTAELKVFIVNVLPEADFTMSKDKGEIPLEVQFDASKSTDPDGEITDFDWDFDQNSDFLDQSGAKIKYTFEKAGNYIVKLRITDNNNEFTIVEKTIQATSPEKPTAVITSSNKKTKYFAGVSYILSAENSSSPFGSITKYRWNLGDGTEASTKTVSHTFDKEGNLKITLEVTDETGEKGQTELEIEVRPPEAAPNATITTSPETDPESKTVSGSLPFKVFFDASKSTDSDNNIVDYRWDLDGNGTIDQTGMETNYTYEKVGEYKALLFVSDADNNEDQESVTVIVNEPGLNASLKASAVSGEVPLEVQFDATASSYSNGKIISYEWEFGDGTPTRIGEGKITYTYIKVGEFVARVTAIASDGSKAHNSLNIIVRPVALQACYTASKKEGAAPLTVTFNPTCSKGTISKYLWDFQGATSTDRKPTYTFKNAGQYKVTLRVIDADNVSAEFSDTIVVQGEKSN